MHNRRTGCWLCSFRAFLQISQRVITASLGESICHARRASSKSRFEKPLVSDGGSRNSVSRLQDLTFTVPTCMGLSVWAVLRCAHGVGWQTEPWGVCTANQHPTLTNMQQGGAISGGSVQTSGSECDSTCGDEASQPTRPPTALGKVDEGKLILQA